MNIRALRGAAGQTFRVRSLHDDDSSHLFQRLNGLVMTGPTGTNEMDVRVVLVG
ncbi:MAG: hypothetical protein HYY12_06880 [Candidatus Methylomirabilis oxyfera]|nr:hypothetical protein [Candidatus Methylomirabilis oxyfera]